MMNVETAFLELSVKTVGEGADRYESRQAGGVELRRFVGRGDYEWRTRDLDVGAMLEYARPREVRSLIRSIRRDKNMSDFAVCGAAPQTSSVGGRPADEFWLTEEEATFLITESQTPKARLIKLQIVRVFLAVKNGEVALLMEQVREFSEFKANLLVRFGELERAQGATCLSATSSAEKADRAERAALEARRYAAEALDEMADGNEAMHGLDSWLRASRSVDGLAGDDFGKWVRTMLVEIARAESANTGKASDKIWPEVNTKARDVARLPMGGDWSEVLEAYKGATAGYLSQRLRRAKAKQRRRSGGGGQGRLRFPRKGRR